MAAGRVNPTGNSTTLQVTELSQHGLGLVPAWIETPGNNGMRYGRLLWICLCLYLLRGPSTFTSGSSHGGAEVFQMLPPGRGLLQATPTSSLQVSLQQGLQAWWLRDSQQQSLDVGMRCKCVS